MFFQHANEDVEKMILGNKCDMSDKRTVSKERGETVSLIFYIVFIITFYLVYKGSAMQPLPELTFFNCFINFISQLSIVSEIMG